MLSRAQPTRPLPHQQSSLASRPGPATCNDVRTLCADFRRLWDTGFLDDLQIEVVDGAAGKVVRFKVTVSFTFTYTDEDDDEYTCSKTLQVRVAP
jgi:hypothetical protein